jgi:hypothetical protein
MMDQLRVTALDAAKAAGPKDEKIELAVMAVWHEMEHNPAYYAIWSAMAANPRLAQADLDDTLLTARLLKRAWSLAESPVAIAATITAVSAILRAALLRNVDRQPWLAEALRLARSVAFG